MQRGTLFELLAGHARTRGADPAILAPGRPALSFADLWTEVERTGAALADLGLGRASRVACVVRPGPDIAVALVTCMQWTACAPLNPDLERDAYRTLFPKLRVDALIALDGEDSAAIGVARAAGIPVLTLAPSDGAAGMIVLAAVSRRRAASRSAASPDDLATIHHTSGTTGIPKVVPLTHAQFLVRCRAIPFTAADRCLSIAPLHTSTGIKYGLFAPLGFGASVVCVPDVRAEHVVEWLDEFRPTYLNASPALFEAFVDLVARAPPPRSLRFVRTAASALTPALHTRLEAALGAPVIQSYGMTESGTIAQIPLPPGQQRPGSVGLPLDLEIVVADERGGRLPPRAVGEVLVRGPGLMSGYEDDPDANRAAFLGDWFRTGDLGYLDEDGYLYLRGRLKEMINRGGTKVSPVDVDEALLQHPAVREAAAFGVPHPSLGEDVAAAVVLNGPEAVDEPTLRDFCLERLAPFKVPTRIVAVGELPRNAQGKVKRLQLAETLEHHLSVPFSAPRDAYEELVATAFAHVLAVDKVGIHDNFFAIGGDSLRGAQAISRISAALGTPVTISSLFRRPTAAELAVELRDSQSAVASSPPIRPRQRAAPLE
jgi:acyl-CoA synthetase (AMP-forming)/AMP-acid ligase II